MSAFLVAPNCINCIVTYLHHHSDRFGWLKENLGYDVSQNKELGRLSIALHLLNCAGMAVRYGKRTAERDAADVGPFIFHFVQRPPVAVLKAVECLCYQCAEGDVPEEPLFKALETIGSEILEHLESTSGYDEAPWGD